ncbi:MAG: ParA family protein [Deltaproteobacteria bacterium]|nr:ParA family protein [Deltaproteobacteria bacterium]
MDAIKYNARRFAEVLGLSTQELAQAESRGTLALAREPLPPGVKPTYTAQDLDTARKQLNLMPARRPMRKQLFLNFKGGTGKTSVSTSYAFRLAEMGHRVLVIDLDSQGHASKCLGVEGEEAAHTLFDAIIKKVPIEKVIVPTGMPGLDLVPSNLSMSTIDLSLMPLAAREFRLRNCLKDVETRYDFVVLDAPPSFGLLNLNALMAANDLFVPVLADFLSFHGLKLLFETVQSLEEDLEHVLDHIFIVINAYNATYKIAKEAREALEKHYPDFLVKQVIRQCTKFAQASSEGTPIFAYDAESKGAEDIQAVLDEVRAKIGEAPKLKLATAPGAKEQA